MIDHSIFALSDAILSDQKACFLSYNIIEEDLAKIQTNFVRSYVVLLDHMIVDRPYK